MSFLLKQVVQSVKLVCNVQKNILSNYSSSSFPIQHEVLCNKHMYLQCNQLTSVRQLHYKKLNRGFPRPLPEWVPRPKPGIYGGRPVYPADGIYTTKPLPYKKMGGRDPITGRVVVTTIGGGHKKKFRWVCFKREGPKDGSTLVEKVFEVRYDPCRTADIALVASGDRKRWILATENMKPGDLIETSSVIPQTPVNPKEGNAHPLGALPIGTLVHNIEIKPGGGGCYCKAAGASAVIIKKFDHKCVIMLQSKLPVCLHEECMAVCGRVSNVNHGERVIGSPNRLRWLGRRPRSGLWHRKDGYCGRKVRPPKAIKDMLAPSSEKIQPYKLTYCK